MVCRSLPSNISLSLSFSLTLLTLSLFFLSLSTNSLLLCCMTTAVFLVCHAHCGFLSPMWYSHLLSFLFSSARAAPTLIRCSWRCCRQVVSCRESWPSCFHSTFILIKMLPLCMFPCLNLWTIVGPWSEVTKSSPLSFNIRYHLWTKF